MRPVETAPGAPACPRRAWVGPASGAPGPRWAGTPGVDALLCRL